MSACFGRISAEHRNNWKNRHSLKESHTCTIYPLQRSSSEGAIELIRDSPNTLVMGDNDRILMSHPASSSIFARRIVVRSVLMIYNPSSGSRKGEHIMHLARSELEQHGITVQVIPLQHKNHAMEICKSHDFSAFDVLCVVGGDGTFHECINGLMSRRTNTSTSCVQEKLPVLAIIPAGTGNSLVLELAGVSNFKYSISRMIQGLSIPIDILKVTVLDTHKTGVNSQGMGSEVAPSYPAEALLDFSNEPQVENDIKSGRLEKEVIYAFNSIHWGLGSKVSETAERFRWMRHALRYTSAALVEIMRSSSTKAKIVMEDQYGNISEIDDDFCLLIANNIGTAAKGMKMAPDAKINDGLIDLLLFKSHRVPDLLRVFKKVYKGTHTQLPYVEYKQVRKFAVIPFKPYGREGNPEIAEELVDIDGELKGCTPFMCEMIPTPLEIIV